MKKLDVLWTVLIGLIIGVFVMSFIACRVKVEGVSMEPTYHDGDSLLIYKLGTPDKGDIITFKNEGRNLIKRVIATPGDSVKIENSKVIVNGNVIKEDYIKEDDFGSGFAENEKVLAEDEYFVLGDNRNNSIDSRVFGVIKEDSIMGVKLVDLFF